MAVFLAKKEKAPLALPRGLFVRRVGSTCPRGSAGRLGLLVEQAAGAAEAVRRVEQAAAGEGVRRHAEHVAIDVETAKHRRAIDVETGSIIVPHDLCLQGKPLFGAGTVKIITPPTTIGKERMIGAAYQN